MLWPTIESPVDKKVEVEINFKKWSIFEPDVFTTYIIVNETVHLSFETEESTVPFFPSEISATGIPLWWI